MARSLIRRFTSLILAGCSVMALQVLTIQSLSHQTTTVSRRKNNVQVRRLLEIILARHNETLDRPRLNSNWAKLRNYLYHSADTLSVGQVERVCDFLGAIVDPDTEKFVLQTTPRILRRTVSSNLEPTAQFLRGLYGDAVFRYAIRRNPTLLLMRGSGYNIDTLDLVTVYLQRDLHFTDAALRKVRASAPQLFRMPLSTVLPTVSYLQGVLAAASSLSDADVQVTLSKLITLHPTLLQLSAENLTERVNYLVEELKLDANDLAGLIRRNPSILGLSVEQNLKPSIEFLGQLVPPPEIGKCVRKHPAILGLSLRNLEAKQEFFDSVDGAAPPPKVGSPNALAARILRRSPAVYSLSIESLKAKVAFLSAFWGIGGECGGGNDDEKHNATLRDLLSEDPSILTLSLEGNLRPTVRFLNQTGHVPVNEQWRLMPGFAPVRPRFLAASLSGRLVPRWCFVQTRLNSANATLLPLYVLATGTDDSFCRHCQCKLDDYREFRRIYASRWNWTTPGDAWLGTGLAMEEASTYGGTKRISSTPEA